ncbi:MAG: hypothetical protein AAF541_09255 [Pseudomonadota bacterium]
MNGLALSAATLFALLLPGQLAHYIYKQNTGGWSISSPNRSGIPTSLVWGLVIAVPLNTLWGIVCEYVLSRPVDYHAILSVLTNEETSSHLFDEQFATSMFLLWITTYWITQIIAGYGIGLAVTKVADYSSWGLRAALQSNGATWHRLFRAMDWSPRPDAVTASAVVVEDAKPFLYIGIVNTYDLDQEGNLQRLVLEGAHRRYFPADSDPNVSLIESGDISPWTQMRGELFVINCEKVQTIDVDYIWIAEDTEDRGDSKSDS